MTTTPYDPPPQIMTRRHIVDFVDHMQRYRWQELGFLPRRALEEYADRGQIMIVHHNAQPAGFMLYYDGRHGNPPRKTPFTTKIHQICITDELRRQQLATTMIRKLTQLVANKGHTHIQCHCATDLPAVAFWEALGFELIRTRRGGSRDKRTHNLYRLDIRRDHETDNTPETHAST